MIDLKALVVSSSC